MKKYLVEIILAVVLLGVYFAVANFQSASTITKEEVEDYTQKLEKEVPQELPGRAEFISRLRAWAANDDGQPVYMLNSMRFYNQLQPFPGAPTSGTPLEANAKYEEVVTPMLLSSGGYPLFEGPTTRFGNSFDKKSNIMVYDSLSDNLDRVLLVRYPGRRSFLDLVTNTEYLKIMPNKLASLEVILTPTTGQLVIPDLRWIAGGFCLAVFLLVGWIRAARRKA